MAVSVYLFLVILYTTSLALSSLSPNVTYNHKNTLDSDQLTYNNRCTSDSQCPTWYFCENTTKQCKCGKTFQEVIKCSEESGTAYVLNCYCVTYNEDSNSTQAGLCFYNCDSDHQTIMNNKVYHLLPANPAKD